MNDPIRLWDRQSDETDPAFAAWRAYLNMGYVRSLRGVAQKLGKSATLMGKWSRRWKWQARVRAHADHLAELEHQQEDDTIKAKAKEWVKREEQIRELRWEKGMALINKASEILKRPLERTELKESITITPDMVGKTIQTVTVYKATRWTQEGAAKLIKAGDFLLSMAANIPTDYVKNEINVPIATDPEGNGLDMKHVERLLAEDYAQRFAAGEFKDVLDKVKTLTAHQSDSIA